MHDARQFLEFVRLPVFERQARGLLDEDDVREIEQDLMQDPTAGNVIAGTGGLRKLRYAWAARARVAASESSTFTEARRADSTSSQFITRVRRPI